MDFLDKTASLNWIEKNNISALNKAEREQNYPFHFKYKIPVDSGKKVALAKKLSSLFNQFDEAIIYIHEFGIWPSCEEIEIFNGYRKSLGEMSFLSEKPGHLFKENELVQLRAIITICILFFWGAICSTKNSKYFFIISHDEIIDFYIKEKEVFDSFSQLLNSQ